MGMFLTRLITCIAKKREQVILMGGLNWSPHSWDSPRKSISNDLLYSPCKCICTYSISDCQFVDIPISECSSPKGEGLRMSLGWEISFLFSFTFVFLLQFLLLFLLSVHPSAYVLTFHELIHVAWSPRNTSWLIDLYRRHLGQRRKKNHRLRIRWKPGFQ